MRGRPPVPTALKVLRGNPGKRALSKTAQPSGTANCPDWLLPRAKAIWAERAPELDKQGVLTARDTEIFAAYCQELALYEGFNRLCTGKKPDVVIRKGYLTRASKHLENANKIAARFGMTPSDRARIHTPPKVDDPDAEFLFGDSRTA